ncbi:hypothetical protein Tco_1349019, partial [Tanacetum coccineum]
MALSPNSLNTLHLKKKRMKKMRKKRMKKRIWKEKKRSNEALEIGSNSEPPGYAAIDDDVESDLESTARSEPKCKEMEDTYE